MSMVLLADLVLLLHFCWIVFILAGLWLCRRWPWLGWPHLASLVAIVVLNLGGWYCPLTWLEYQLRLLDPGAAPHPGSFIFIWMECLVYLRAPESWLRWAGALWGVANLAGHAWLWQKPRRASRPTR